MTKPPCGKFGTDPDGADRSPKPSSSSLVKPSKVSSPETRESICSSRQIPRRFRDRKGCAAAGNSPGECPNWPYEGRHRSGAP